MSNELRIAIYHNLPSGGSRRARHQFMQLRKQRGHVLHLYALDTADEQLVPLAPGADPVFIWNVASMPLFGPMSRPRRRSANATPGPAILRRG